MKLKKKLLKQLTRDGGYFAHGIADPLSAPAISPDRITHVHPEDFEMFVAKSRKTDAITFDDGYADNLTTALPILERHQRRATVFITTGFINRTHPLLARVAAFVARDDNWFRPSVVDITRGATDAQDVYERLRAALKTLGSEALAVRQTAILSDYRIDCSELTADYLSREQLRVLDEHPLITVGAHTRSHPDLRFCSEVELRRELQGAREELETWLGHAVTTLAYPFGDTNWRVRRAASVAGYTRAYITEHANWRSRTPFYSKMDLPRIDLSGEVRRMHRRARKRSQSQIV
ncbi:MAG: polysaccharide deacetylase family protein [Salinisphaera sp.]|jgi:peptidoglycan/xylan/chitin deacetylase (PgdA/CDA1 family)|nr:polysaccharide deacetylase family protein [Salinisphaera sp.]